MSDVPKSFSPQSLIIPAGVNWRERLEGENTLEEDLFALFEDLKNSGPRGNNRVKQVCTQYLLR